MKQQCCLADEQIEAVVLDTLEFFRQPEYEVPLRAQVLRFARALRDAASIHTRQN